jgi:hypothetical protein
MRDSFGQIRTFPVRWQPQPPHTGQIIQVKTFELHSVQVLVKRSSIFVSHLQQ